MDRCDPTGKLLKKSVHFSRLDQFRSKWTVSDSFSTAVPRRPVLSMYNMEEDTYHGYFMDSLQRICRFYSYIHM